MNSVRGINTILPSPHLILIILKKNPKIAHFHTKRSKTKKMKNTHKKTDDRNSHIKVRILKVFSLLPLAAPLAIICNCRCVFGLQFRFQVLSPAVIDFFFVCSASVTVYSLALADQKKQYTASHTGELKSESVGAQSPLCYLIYLNENL